MKVKELIAYLSKQNPELEVQFMSELHKGVQIQDSIKDIAHTSKMVILIGTERGIDGEIEPNHGG